MLMWPQKQWFVNSFRASFIHWLVTLWSPEEEELHKQHFFLWMGLSLSLSCITLPIQGIINLLAMHLLCHTSNLLLLHFNNWMDLFNLFIIKSQRTFPLIFCNRFFFFCFVLCLMRSNNILIFLYSNEFMQILKSGRHAAVEEALESFEYAQSVLISRPASTLTQAALVVTIRSFHGPRRNHSFITLLCSPLVCLFLYWIALNAFRLVASGPVCSKKTHKHSLGACHWDTGNTNISQVPSSWLWWGYRGN